MDDRMYPSRYEAFGTSTERMRPYAEKRKENPFHSRAVDSSVDPNTGSTMDKAGHFFSPRILAKERDEQSRLHAAGFHEGTQLLEQNERMERQLQQSVQLLNHKKRMQQQLLMMQQQQIQQQQIQQHQIQQQQQIPQQQQIQQQQQIHQQQIQQHHHIQQQPQPQFQPHLPRQMRQRSPERLESPGRQQRDKSEDIRQGFKKHENQYSGELSAAPQFSESFDDMTVHDLFVQCQNHLNVINACTDLQQMIRDEMRKQAKLDNIISQKLVSKSHRLQQQAAILEKAHAPSWVGPALNELGSQVNQQAEMHHVYTSTLMEQCVVIQHSLDGHHELMKSVLAQHQDSKQNLASPMEVKNTTGGNTTTVPEKTRPNRIEEDFRSMTFLQASNIFEGIRKPRMKYLSSLEYQQEQLSATLMHLEQVDAEIETLSKKEENDNIMWRTHLERKDLEIRKEFLETRKEQLESDVQFARMDLTDFEYSNRDSMLEVLNVFRQHRVRYDTTLKQSFQLLRAASLRDITFLRQLAKKSDREAELESGDVNDVSTRPQCDPWNCPPKVSTDDSAITRNTDDEEVAFLSMKLQNNSTPPIVKNKNTFSTKSNMQEQIDMKSTKKEQPQPMILSSDSDISLIGKSDKTIRKLYSPDFKKSKNTASRYFRNNPFDSMTDFNFSRAESSTSISESNDVKPQIEAAGTFHKSSQSRAWKIIKKTAKGFTKEDYVSENEESGLIIAKYTDDVSFSKCNSRKCQNNSGLEDIMIMTRGPKSRPTLGNFEACINSECSVSCLCPLSAIREMSYNREDKRVAHLINKYASGTCSRKHSLSKNWNSSRPMVWCGISNSIIGGSTSCHKVSRRLKYYKPLAQHNLLTEYTDNNKMRSSENDGDHLKGHNMNNSETLRFHSDHPTLKRCDSLTELNLGVKSHEFSIRQKSSELLLGHSISQGTESSIEHNSDMNAGICEQLTGHTVICHQSDTDHNESQNINSCGTLDSQYLVMGVNNCQQIAAQLSSNLNNCEPLKNCVACADNVLEREDRLEFEVTQVLFPDSQPRNIQVCAVRPIPTEVDSESTELTSIKSQEAGFKDEEIQTGIPYKYDNLKLYELTAGQFIVHEEETDRKRGMSVVNSSNNKRAGFCDVSNQSCSRPICVQKTIYSSSSDRLNESFSQKMVGSNTKLQSGKSDCKSLPLTSVAIWHPTGVLYETLYTTVHSATQHMQAPYHINRHCLEAAEKDKHISEQVIVPVDNNKETCTSQLEKSKNNQSLSNLTYTRPEIVYVMPTIVVNEELPENLWYEEETVPKTLYVLEKLDTDAQCTNDNQINCAPRSVTESSGACIYADMQDFSNYETEQDKELQMNSTIWESDAYKDEQNTCNINYEESDDDGRFTTLEESEDCIEGQFTQSTTIIPASYDSSDIRISEDIHAQNEAKMTHTISKRADNQIKDCDLSSSDSSQQELQEYITEQINDPTFQDVKIFINNIQPQTRNIPLKSSLKKPILIHPLDVDSDKDTSESTYQRSSLTLSSTDDMCSQTDGEHTSWQQINNEEDRYLNSGKIQKRIKQVRFDHRVHYDDNTEIDTTDISQEHIPVSSYSLNSSNSAQVVLKL